MFLCSLRYCLKCYFSKGMYSFTLSTVPAVQDCEMHYMNAWLKRCVFNLDLNRESVSEPQTFRVQSSEFLYFVPEGKLVSNE